MTAPNGSILFNSSTGSDTAASGLGPATALTGTTGTSTATSAVVTGIDTTGVSAGDLFWGNTSSGRQFSIIASVDSGTQVTLDDVLDATHSGNLTWAIGGKRAILGNASSARILASDAKGGWTVETETDQSVSAAIDWGVLGLESAPVKLIGSSGAVRTITQSANAPVINIAVDDVYYIGFENIKLANSNVTKTLAVGMKYDGSVRVRATKCVFGDATNQLLNAFSRVGAGDDLQLALIECDVQNLTGDFGSFGASNGTVIEATLCNIRDGGGIGIHSATGTSASLYVHSSVIEGCAGDGIFGIGQGHLFVANSHVWGNGGDGIDYASMGGSHLVSVTRNVIGSNGGWNIRADTTRWPINITRNAFYASTSGDITGAEALDSIQLTADPFVDAANDDYNLNNNAGGGAALRAATLTLPGT